MANLTRRQKIKIRSRIQSTIVLVGALAVVLGVLVLIGMGIGRLISRVRPAEEPVPAEIVEPVTVTPEPENDLLPSKPDVDVTAWNLRLVRKDHPLPEDFQPDLMDIENDQQFDARAGKYLLQLIADARAAGYTVYCCSGFRPYETQYLIYWNHVNEYMDQGMTQEAAEAATRLAVNYPGGSEHQLGLAMDLLEYAGQDMQPYIGGSGLMLWLEEHCADYGFIIRYPDGKTDITGVEYEPWHLRFVGTCARYIMENDLCLEEFLALYE